MGRHYFITIIMLSLASHSSAQGTEDPWLLSWPIFENTSGPSGVFNGYGDWCVRDEGPHPGLDFAVISGDSVIVPSDSNMVSLGARDYGSQGCAMGIGPSREGNPPWWGWGLLHLDIENPSDSPFVAASQLDPSQPLAPCLQYSWPGGPAPLHLHLAWIECDANGPVDPPFIGYHNSFDYFFDDLSTYDEVQFKKVCHELGSTGAWFMPDGFETAAQFGQAPGSPSASDFQDVVFNMVDIAVSPISAFQGISSRDSAGVYAVAYEILMQNPLSPSQWSSTESSQGDWGLRWLMEMRDELPYGDSDEYRALFADGSLLNGDTISTPYPIGENAYIVTNSGALDTSSWNDGLDNVWTDASDDDWTDGICRGSWNTFLAKQEYSGDPTQNCEAFFPDGRYAAEVTAISHGVSSDN